MTNKDFIRRTSKNYRIPQKTIRKVLDAVELELKQEMVNGNNKVKLCDIIFYPKLQKGKMARNPKTGEQVEVKPFRKIKIAMSTDWKEIFKYYKDYCDKK